MPPSMKRGPSLAHLETAFSQFDLDGTGSVTVADLEAIERLQGRVARLELALRGRAG